MRFGHRTKRRPKMSVVPVLCECKLLHRWIALAFPLRVPGGAVSFAAMLKRKTSC